MVLLLILLRVLLFAGLIYAAWYLIDRYVGVDRTKPTIAPTRDQRLDDMYKEARSRSTKNEAKDRDELAHRSAIEALREQANDGILNLSQQEIDEIDRKYK